jgi:hypothetical protein
LETVKGVTLGLDLDKRDLKRPTAGGTVTAGGTAPSLPGEVLAVAASDSKLARRVPRSQPLPRDPLAGEHERKQLRPKTVELSPGSTSWRREDLRPADGQIMEVGASMSADIAGLFVMLPGQAVVRWVAMGLLARLSSTLTLTPVRLP